MHDVTLKEWAEALRSGKYKQGQRKLRSSHQKYCCLGVLCDLADPEKWTPTPNDEGSDTWDEFSDNYPPVRIVPEVLHEVYYQLGELNDRGVDFETVAGVLDAVDADPDAVTEIVRKALDKVASPRL